MTYDTFVNECINYLTREGLLMQPQVIEISGKKYYEEIWWFYTRKDSKTGSFSASFHRYRIIEKNEKNKNGVVSAIINNNWVLTEIGYAQDISNFYTCKYEVKAVYMTVSNDEFTAKTDTSINETVNPDNKKYPSEKDAKWYNTSQGVGRKVEHYHYSFSLPKDRENEVTSFQPFKTTYDIYKYLLNDDVTFVKIKGHSGNVGNELVDKLAVAAKNRNTFDNEEIK